MIIWSIQHGPLMALLNKNKFFWVKINGYKVTKNINIIAVAIKIIEKARGYDKKILTDSVKNQFFFLWKWTFTH